MGFLGRMLYATQGVIAVAVLGLIYAQVGVPLINDIEAEGGPFTPVATRLETVIPLLISFLLLFVVVWFIASGAQQERARDQRRPPR